MLGRKEERDRELRFVFKIVGGKEEKGEKPSVEESEKKGEIGLLVHCLAGAMGGGASPC